MDPLRPKKAQRPDNHFKLGDDIRPGFGRVWARSLVRACDNLRPTCAWCSVHSELRVRNLARSIANPSKINDFERESDPASWAPNPPKIDDFERDSDPASWAPNPPKIDDFDGIPTQTVWIGSRPFGVAETSTSTMPDSRTGRIANQAIPCVDLRPCSSFDFE